MNCADYTHDFLSAHADDELGPAEKRAAEEHLARCPDCNRRLSEERQLKALLKTCLSPKQAPADVREGVMRALKTEAAGRGASRPVSRSRRRGSLAVRRHAIWIATAALAASAVIVFFAARDAIRRPRPLVANVESPTGFQFDHAVEAFQRFNRNFKPNLPSGSPVELAHAYAAAHMPDSIWNFERSGIALVGGRLETLPDGRQVSYTFYRGANRSILCARFKFPGAKPPAGAARVVANHAFYRYRGYSVCLTCSVGDGFVCLLVSRCPVDDLVREVQIASQ